MWLNDFIDLAAAASLRLYLDFYKSIEYVNFVVTASGIWASVMLIFMFNDLILSRKCNFS